MQEEAPAGDEDAYDDEHDPEAGPSSHGDHNGGDEDGNSNQEVANHEPITTPSASNEVPSSEVVHVTPAAAPPAVSSEHRAAAASPVEPSSPDYSMVVESQWRVEEGGTHNQPGGVWYMVFIWHVISI